MNDNEIKEAIKPLIGDYITQHLGIKLDRNNQGICPLCKSGTGKNKSGAFTYYPDTNSYSCFSCHSGGDIFNLIGEYENITDFTAQIERAKHIFNITEFTQKAEFTQKTRITRKARGDAMETKKADFTSYINECKNRVNEILPYLKSRGFNDETIKRFNLGFDPFCYFPSMKRKEPSLIIPYSNNYYIARAINYHEFYKPGRDKAGEEPIFNLADLYNTENKPVFICEAPIDAMSLIQAGAYAVSIGGTGSDKLIEAIEEKKPTATLILSLDNDDPGRKASEKLAQELTEKNIDFSVAKYTLDNYPENKRKDANDFLITNFEQLKKDVALNTDPKEVIKLYSGSGRLEGFIKNINDPSKNIFIPTGFNNLDKELDGGLYTGLYIIGATSSLGKTTFVLNIADYLAEHGNDILYFSLEMGASELMAKSISKLTYTLSGKDEKISKTNRGITTGKRYANYSPTEKNLINEAVKKYSSYANNFYIYEGLGDIGVEKITSIVKNHIKVMKKKPIVFVDYLQILAPYDPRATDKYNTDTAVTSLKCLSRDYDIPVIAISSFNRDNYTTAVNMTAFKESGAIEYGSDVLLALQPKGMETGKGKEEKNKKLYDECKAGKIRSLEAVILKNRNGKTNGKIDFMYNPMFNYFEEGNQIETIQNKLDEWYNNKNNIVQK